MVHLIFSLALEAHVLAELWHRLKAARELCNEPTESAATSPAKICPSLPGLLHKGAVDRITAGRPTQSETGIVRGTARGAIGTSPATANGRELWATGPGGYPPTILRTKDAPLCVSSAKKRYLQEKSHKQRAYLRCLRLLKYRELRNGNLSKSQVPICRGPVRVETLIPSPQFVCKHGGSGRQEKSEYERNESNQGWMGSDFESQVSAHRGTRTWAPGFMNCWVQRSLCLRPRLKSESLRVDAPRTTLSKSSSSVIEQKGSWWRTMKSAIRVYSSMRLSSESVTSNFPVWTILDRVL